jgi:outer membrane immunogenic protein
MKKFLLSSVALLGFSAGAMAADLPRRAPPVFAPIPVFTWTGFYVGVNAGYAWNNSDDGDCLGCNALTVDTPAFLLGSSAPVVPLGGGFLGLGGGGGGGSDGFTGGAQIGFNYQFTPGAGFVLGFEADIQWLGGDDDNSSFFGGGFTAVPTAAVTQGVGSGIAPPVVPGGNNIFLFGNGFNNRVGSSDWWATARVRVGYAFDRTLIYATGGVAFTDDNRKDDAFLLAAPIGGFFTPAGLVAAAVAAPAIANRNDSNNVGWVLGAGVEYAFTNNLTVKLEGLWVNLDRDNIGVFANDIVGVSNNGAPIRRGFVSQGDDSSEFFVARIGVNWKFGS